MSVMSDFIAYVVNQFRRFCRLVGIALLNLAGEIHLPVGVATEALDAEVKRGQQMVQSLHEQLVAMMQPVNDYVTIKREDTATAILNAMAEHFQALQRRIETRRRYEEQQTPVALAAKVEQGAGCPICGAPWLEHRCPYTSPRTVMHVCDVCDIPLPADALRTHDGKFRCRAHKNVDPTSPYTQPVDNPPDSAAGV